MRAALVLGRQLLRFPQPSRWLFCNADFIAPYSYGGSRTLGNCSSILRITAKSVQDARGEEDVGMNSRRGTDAPVQLRLSRTHRNMCVLCLWQVAPTVGRYLSSGVFSYIPLFYRIKVRRVGLAARPERGSAGRPCARAAATKIPTTIAMALL